MYTHVYIYIEREREIQQINVCVHKNINDKQTQRNHIITYVHNNIIHDKGRCPSFRKD